MGHGFFVRLVSTALFLSGGTPLAFAEDLDVAGAKAKYDSQRSVADAAKRRMDSAYSSLSSAESLLQSAQARENQAVSEKDNAERLLSQIENEVASLHREIDQAQLEKEREQRRLDETTSSLDTKRNLREELRRRQENLDRRVEQTRQKLSQLENATGPGNWTCVAVDKGWEEHSGGHPGKGGTRDEAETKAREACKLSHGECNINSCEKNSAEVNEVRRQLERLVAERDTVAQQVRNADSEISSLDSERERLRQNVYAKEELIRDRTYRLSERTSARDRQNRVVTESYETIRRARQAVDLASSEVSAARPPYQSAKSAYEFEDRLAGDAYAYYQRVLANYQAALNSVYAKADRAGSLDGNREAVERAVRAGESDGANAGRQTGAKKAEVDAKARDYLKGYLEGRNEGATNPLLSSAYSGGTSAGELLARKKAQAEDFPKGFNAALTSHLGGSLPNATQVDISTDLSSDPGGSPVLLSLKALAVGQGTGPSVKVPPEPNFQVPVAGTPSFSVPFSLKLYFTPPCVALVLPEFEALCEARYDSVYQAQYQSSYQTLYRDGYRRSFGPAAEAAYSQSLSIANNDALTEGRGVGAKEQGTLDGFAGAVPSMQQQEFAAGQRALSLELTKGGLVVVRGLKIVESSGDGLVTSGEAVKLRLMLDNYGAGATASLKVRARVVSAQGFETVTSLTRELPALAGLTRTTLDGVLSLPVALLSAGDKVKVEVAVEANEGNGWKELGRIKAEETVQFPVELTSITIPANPKVGAKTNAKFKFVNRLAVESPALKGALSTNPGFVTFEKGDIEIPALAPGGEFEVETSIEPGPWVGDNTFVNFVAALEFPDRKTKQSFAKIIEVDRPVSLLLFNASGIAVPSSTLVVRAGSIVVASVELKYRAKTSLPGPFIVRAAKISSPAITHANFSTTSVNYGSLSPGTTMGRVNFMYQVPASLAGKQEWVMIQAEQGSSVQHAMMVYLDIR